MLTLGIDVGTSSVKVLALSTEEGRVIASGLGRHAVFGRGEVLEAEPSQWIEATQMALQQCLSSLGPAVSQVAAIGLTGNMSSVVVVDRAGRPLRRAMLLADTRGVEEIRRIPASLRDDIEARSHNPINTAFSLPKLLWLAKNDPLVVRSASAWLSAKDYVRLWLTGQLATDLTDAYNSLLVEANTAAWRFDIAERLGISSDIFPPIYESQAVAGTVTANAAVATGIRKGTPVVCGMGDMAAAALGAGSIEPGDGLISLGTSTTVLSPLGDRPLPDAWHGRLTYHPLPRPMGFFSLASLLTGGLAINWLREATGVVPTTSGEIVPDVDNPLIFLPHLSGAGSPDFDPTARGTIFGLTASTDMSQLFAALYEAVAFELRTIITIHEEVSAFDSISITGGATHLRPFLQVIADVLGLPLRVPAHVDVSALGAAVLAAHADHTDGLLVLPVAGQQKCEVVEPRASLRDTWLARAERYRRAREQAGGYYTRPGSEPQASLGGRQ